MKVGAENHWFILNQSGFYTRNNHKANHLEELTLLKRRGYNVLSK